MKNFTFLLLFFFGIYNNAFTQCGNIVFSSQEDIDNFSINYPNCTEIQGTLQVLGYPGVNNLNGLSQITSISGDLSINGSQEILNLQGLENLSFIGNELIISYCSEIQTLSELSNLSSVQNIDLSNNISLLNLEGLEQIDSINNISIYDNEMLNSLAGLNGLEYVNSSFLIGGNDSLGNISALNNLKSVGYTFSIWNAKLLTNLSGLENLDSVGVLFSLTDNLLLTDISQLSNLNNVGNLSIKNCDLLTSFDGLENINSYNNKIWIQENDILTDISALANLNVIDNILITDNNSLINLDGLQNVDSIHNEFRLMNNPSLNNLNHLNNLSYVGTHLTIEECLSLENFIGLENLQNIGERLLISNNQNLINLMGLNNLDTIGGYLWIEQNSSLTNIEALGQLKYIGNSILIGNIGTTNGISNGLPNLESLKGLEGVTQINGDLNINECGKIKNLEGLENVNFIKETLWIRGNDSLKNLWGIHNLDSLGGDLWIVNNDTLDHLGAFGDVVFSDMNYLRINANPNLSLCNEFNICNYLSNGGDHFISTNQSGCNDIDEILDACNDRFAKISIQPFYDVNENQIRDSNELILPNAEFYSNHFNATFFSNTEEQLFYVDSGYYVVEYQENLSPIWSLTTDSISYTLLIDNFDQCDTLYFGFYPAEQIFNPITLITAPPARCGEFIPLKAQINNLGTTTLDGTLWLKADAIISTTNFIDTPDTTVAPNLYGWHFENLYPGYLFDAAISLQVPIPPNVMIGDSLRFNSYVEYEDVNGTILSDDFYYPTEIRCSFDPNDKLVNPSRNNNLTLFEEDLIYTIRFQNTGNDEAYDIIIRDTLDENLDPTSFRVLSTSHPNSLITSMEADQFLTFNFENIYLPDSTTNFDASQGYVSYLIAPKEGLDEETLIENTASIYFDFNPPIVTNTTENVMVSELPTSIHNLGGTEGMKIEIFPNPVSDYIFIKKEKPETLEYQITDVNGRILMNGELIDEVHNATAITFTKMNSGIYFIKIINPATREYIVEKIVK